MKSGLQFFLVEPQIKQFDFFVLVPCHVHRWVDEDTKSRFSSETRSKTTKELKPMLFKPVQCQSCQTKCTQCCTFHLLRFCITTFWFWRNFGIMKFSASQRLTCQTKWLNAGLSILHVSALEIIMQIDYCLVVFIDYFVFILVLWSSIEFNFLHFIFY